MRKNLPIRAASLIATDCDCLHACRYDARVVELTLPEMRRLRYTDVGGAQQTRLFNARMQVLTTALRPASPQVPKGPRLVTPTRPKRQWQPPPMPAWKAPYLEVRDDR